jgi:hypothetical protein
MLKRNAIILAILLTTASCLPPDRIGRHPAAFDPAPRLAFEPISDIAVGLQIAMAGMGPGTASGRGGGIWSGSTPWILPRTGEDARRALECLTAAVYYEARSEPPVGQRAVAQVVLNRVRDPAFPKSVCGVVYQGTGADRRPGQGRGCQFQFACDGSMLMRRDPVAWARSRIVARAALGGAADGAVGGATYYHTNQVSPYWAPGLTRIASIGAHIFYGVGAAWRGVTGSRHYAGGEPSMERAAMAAAATRRATDVPVPPRGAEPDTAVRIHRGEVLAGVAVHRGGAMPGMPAAPTGEAETTGEEGIQIHHGQVPVAEAMAASTTAVDVRPAN